MNTPINEAVERADPVTKEDLMHAIFDKVARAEDLMADQPPHRAMERFNEASATLKSMIDQLFDARAALPPPIVEPVAWAVTAKKGGIHKLSITRESAERKASRWLTEWPDNECRVRPLIFGDTTPASAPSDGAADARDAARYRWLVEHYARGDGYRDIDDALNNGEADKYLSPAIDAAIASTHTTTGGENE